MKSLLCILLCLCLLLFTGCRSDFPAESTSGTVPAASTEQTTPPQATSTPEETVTAVEYDSPIAAVTAPMISESTYTDDGTLLFTYTYQDLSIIMGDSVLAEAITLDILNRTDVSNTAAQNSLLAAKSNYNGQADWQPYFLDIRSTPVRLDQMILSLFQREIIFDGSPRSAIVDSTINYDMLTGSALSLQDILVPDYSADALCQKILSSLSEKSVEWLYEDHAVIINDMFSTNTPVDSWYFTKAGLCFYFGPGEIAPTSTGTLHIEIPYFELVGLLKDIYFPAEIVEYFGTPHIESFSQSEVFDYAQYIELNIDPEAEQFLLTCDGVLLDVSIDCGIWLPDGTFEANATLFAAEALTSSDALVIRMFDETQNQLCLRFTSEGVSHQIPLTQ